MVSYKTKKQTIIALSLGIALLCGGVLVFFYSAGEDIEPVKESLVVLGENGFEPSLLSLYQGGTVTFSSKLGEPFWPASNLHPTHSIYSEFDPKEPIEVNQIWSFTFDRLGEWEFHDHLHPQFTGVVRVVDAQGTFNSVNCKGDKLLIAEKEKCWGDTISEIADEEGVGPAFNVLSKLYDNDDDFISVCHPLTHLIGERAFEIYSADQTLEVSPAMSLCGYGFFHGFLESLFAYSGSLSDVEDFCTYLYRQGSGGISKASVSACYHGWGHGITDGSDSTLWGNVDGMIEKSLLMCRELSKTDFQLSRCATGVFNAIEVLSQEDTYGTRDAIASDPFSICHGQVEIFREPCYTNLLIAVLRLTKDDFLKAFEYVFRELWYPNEQVLIGGTLKEAVTSALFHEYYRVYKRDSDYVEKSVNICRVLPFDVRPSCVGGLSGGHLKYGRPGEEFKEWISFCSGGGLTSQEKSTCFASSLEKLPLMYPQGTVSEVCNSIPKEYQTQSCVL